MRINIAKHNRNFVSYNGVLTVVNHLLFIGTVLFYSFYSLPKLVNLTTLIIYAMLYVQTSLFLRYEAKHSNPYLLVLCYVIIFFYFPRIVTLYIENQVPTEVTQMWSTLNRIRPANVSQVNHTLAFIFAANTSMFCGFFLSYKRINRLMDRNKINARYTINRTMLLTLMSLTIISSLYFTFIARDYSTNFIESYINVILNPLLLFDFGVIYLYFASSTQNNNGELSKQSSLIKNWKKNLPVVFLLTLIVLLRVLVGSRSSTLTVIQSFLFVSLAFGIYHLSRKNILFLLLVVLISFPLFTTATNFRNSIYAQTGEINLERYFNTGVDSSKSSFSTQKLFSLLAPAFSRISYLDMSIDLIKNHNEYQQIVNPIFYFKSIVDNFLTPGGVNFFDTARAANALRSIYTGRSLGLASLSYKSYHSDQLNIYGEFYVMFLGWFSLPVFFLLAYIFGIFSNNHLISLKEGKPNLYQTVLNVFKIRLFFSILLSFGIDWLLGQAVIEYLTILVIFFLLKKRKLEATQQ